MSRRQRHQKLRMGAAGSRGSWIELERLEDRLVLTGIIVQGAGPGSAPEVRVFDSDTGAEELHFSAYGLGMRSGVRVAVGDVNDDGTQDIVTAPGPGANPVVKVFNSTNGDLESQFTLPSSWSRGGAWIAVGDVTGDGNANIVASPGLGAPEIRVYDGTDGQLVESFRADAGAAPGTWTSGAKVAVGDVNGDGYADIVAVPAYGQSVVGVFDGRTGAAITRYAAFAGRTGGRSSVALADLEGDFQLDVVVAQPQGSTAAVKAFSGGTGAFLGRLNVPKSASGSGVQIAAINLGGRGADELAVAPARQRGAGAAILAAAPLSLSPTTAATPAVAYRLPQFARGSFLAGDNSVAVATPAINVNTIEPPLSQALPVLDRLAYFDPIKQQFVPLQPDDPRLAGKDITVITHGWAPGYVDWVNHEANDNHQVLMWWQTFPGQPGFDSAWVQAHPTAPDAAFLLDGISGGVFSDGTPISTTGLAQTILDRANLGTNGPADSNAVVLAYSWIDDSATPTWDFLHVSVPEEAYKSEALTALNGERMAAALEQALGSSFSGKIQLVGHSHGSKVVSVAAVALQQAGLPVNQVTLLDSPESTSTVAIDAANFNWFFLGELQGLNRSSANTTFVENEISEFDVPYSGITLSNGNGKNLNQIVDVHLFPDIYLTADLPDRHSYAPAWYTGSGNVGVTYNQTVGQYWSPLLPVNAGSASPVPGLPAYSEQNWGEFSQPVNQQFVLDPQSGPPTETITFASLSAPAVTVTQSGTMAVSPPTSVRAPYYGQSGISFDYQFPTYQPGDRLIILADGKPAFVMDAALVGGGVNHATLSLAALPFQSHALTFVLTSTKSNTTSKVVISNFQTFDQPIT